MSEIVQEEQTRETDEDLTDGQAMSSILRLTANEKDRTELMRLQSTTFGEAITNLLTRTTPQEVILDRPGRGKQTFRYVPVAWFINQLNALFAFDWDFEIISTDMWEKSQITVLGKLTVRHRDDRGLITISKQQYGGSAIKMLGDRSAPVDIADDYKSAASDSLKKCATLLGLAWDVYGPGREALTEAGPPAEKLMTIYKIGATVGMDIEAVDKWFMEEASINPTGHPLKEAFEAEVTGAMIGLRAFPVKES